MIARALYLVTSETCWANI